MRNGAVTPPVPRYVGRINWLGLWTHYAKEIRRFMKVGLQTLLAPMVTTLLFLAVFNLALGRAVEEIGGVPFARFLAPGLIVFAIIQNAFANTTSSLMMAKIQGSIVDLQMPPLSSGELVLGFALGGATRGLLVGLIVTAGMAAFVPMRVTDLGLILFHAAAASLLMSLVGLLVGIWAEKYDHVASITNFIVTPLSFLSGTFYSIERLPDPWHAAAMFNPFFYLIDGFRYGFTGHADGSLIVGVVYLFALNAVLWAICHRLFASGWKLKS